MKAINVVATVAVLFSFSCSENKKKDVKLDSREIKKDELVVKLVTDSKLVNSTDVAESIELKGKEKVEILGKSYSKDGKFQTLVKVKFDEKNYVKIKESLETNSKVKDTYNNYIYEGNPFDIDEISDEELNFNEPVEYEALHHKLMGTEKAVQIARGEGFVVAVTDSGVEYSHKDLKENIWTNSAENSSSSLNLEECMNEVDEDENGKADDCLGWDFSSNDNDPAPNNSAEYHGSHVAGIVASTENGEGTVGVAPGAKIMSIKFYGDTKWTSTTVLNSYVYAVDNGAHVINTSFNVDRFAKDPIYASALDYANDNGVIVVNSAGNAGRLNPPRAILNKILFVANTGIDFNGHKADEKVDSSNYGAGIDISAPGYKINSTVMDNKYQRATGTSMSSPVVAGALALIWSKNPEWTKEQVVSRLISTADNIDSVNDKAYHGRLGSGRLNLERALSDEAQAFISIGDFIDEPKTISSGFSLATKGVVDWNTLGENTVELFRLKDSADLNSNEFEKLIKESSSKIELKVNSKESLAYGSNKLSFTSEQGKFELGKYLIKISSDLKDPFGNSIDGNLDGVLSLNDHFYKVFEVVEADHYSPLLNKIELLTDKVVTPESENIRFGFDVSDDFSGYRRIVVEFRNSLDFSEIHVVRCAAECLKENGRVEIEVPVSSLSTNGVYYIRHVLIADNEGKLPHIMLESILTEHIICLNMLKSYSMLVIVFLNLRVS